MSCSANHTFTDFLCVSKYRSNTRQRIHPQNNYNSDLRENFQTILHKNYLIIKDGGERQVPLQLGLIGEEIVSVITALAIRSKQVAKSYL